MEREDTKFVAAASAQDAFFMAEQPGLIELFWIWHWLEIKSLPAWIGKTPCQTHSRLDLHRLQSGISSVRPLTIPVHAGLYQKTHWSSGVPEMGTPTAERSDMTHCLLMIDDD
ncbi:MAG: hypothetical protein ACUVRV_08270 [Cyanobacteriota bacterium]